MSLASMCHPLSLSDKMCIQNSAILAAGPRLGAGQVGVREYQDRLPGHHAPVCPWLWGRHLSRKSNRQEVRTGDTPPPPPGPCCRPPIFTPQEFECCKGVPLHPSPSPQHTHIAEQPAAEDDLRLDRMIGYQSIVSINLTIIARTSSRHGSVGSDTQNLHEKSEDDG